MELLSKIRNIIEKLFKNQSKKKLIENAAIIVIIGIVIIIAGGSLFGNPRGKSSPANNNDSAKVEAVSTNIRQTSISGLERDIEVILSKINRVGKVNVMITYSSGTEIVPAYETDKTLNDTDEKDTSGGTRSISQNNYKDRIVFEELPGGVKKPVIIKEMLPEVKGIVIAAEGAGDPVVRESICKAAQALLDIPIHRIQVFERNP